MPLAFLCFSEIFSNITRNTVQKNTHDSTHTLKWRRANEGGSEFYGINLQTTSSSTFVIIYFFITAPNKQDHLKKL